MAKGQWALGWAFIAGVGASAMAAGGDLCHVVYVAKGYVNAANDGTSWDNAFWENDALDRGIRAGAAMLAGVKPPACIDVYVAAGTYKVPPLGYYEMFDRVNIYGGFAVGDDFSMRRFACAGGENDGVPCASDEDCPGGDCDESRVVIITGDRHDDDGAHCTSDADCGDGNRCLGNYCLIGPNTGTLLRYNDDRDVHIDGLTFQSGISFNGGAIRVEGIEDRCPIGSLVVANSSFKHNYAFEAGGAIYSRDARLQLQNCDFTLNRASGGSQDGGGAVNSIRSITEFHFCRFNSNTLVTNFGRGGAIHFRGVPSCATPITQVVRTCRFRENSAGTASSSFGGAIMHGGTRLVVEGSEFHANIAANGGGIFSSGQNVEILACVFTDNAAQWDHASYDGGAASLTYGVFLLADSVFRSNRAGFGGGIYAEGDLTVSNCTFSDNIALDAGGAVLMQGDAARFSFSRFLGNTVGTDSFATGSSLYAIHTELDIEQSSFLDNGPAAGVIVAFRGSISLTNSLFAGNEGTSLILDGPTTGSAINCTIAFNENDSAGLGSFYSVDPAAPVDLALANSVVWANDDGDSSLECTDEISCGKTCPCADCSPQSNCFTCDANFDLDVSHSLIRHPSCVWPGSNNLNVDPKFVRNDLPRDCDGNGWGDPQCPAGPCPVQAPAGCDDYGDFRLRVDSPCIDAGDTTIPGLADTDLDGAPRVQGPAGRVDIGAYEFSFDGGVCRDTGDCPTEEVCCDNVCNPFVDGDGDTIADCADQCPGEDDRIDADQNGTPDCAQFDAIPTTSAWGLVVLALLLCISAKIHRLRGMPLAHAYSGK